MNTNKLVVCDKVFPYKCHKKMSCSQLQYVVFVLIEKYRKDNNTTNDIPNWWPKTITFCHPIVHDANEIGYGEYKNNLVTAIECYFYTNGDSWWFRDLLEKTFTNNAQRFIHLISVDDFKNNVNNLNKGLEENINADVENQDSNHSETEKTDKCVTDRALAKLLTQPVVELCDVMKYGLVTNYVDFLDNQNLMRRKTDKLIVDNFLDNQNLLRRKSDKLVVNDVLDTQNLMRRKSDKLLLDTAIYKYKKMPNYKIVKK